jgi:hypothetical protein
MANQDTIPSCCCLDSVNATKGDATIDYRGIKDDDHQDDSSTSSFLVYTRALHLQCETGMITCHSEEEKDNDDESSVPLSFLGIAIPHEIAHLFLVDCPDASLLSCSRDENIRDQVREKMLSMIHPSLIQLEPVVWFRNNDEVYKEEKCPSSTLPFLVGGVKDVLILKIASSQKDCGLDCGKREKEWAMVEYAAALQSIVEEIHGEAMTAAPYRVIQVYTIRKLEWILANSNKDEDLDNIDGNKSQSTENVQPIMDMPMCPVCRFRIMPERLGLPELKPHQKCSCQGHACCPNMKFLGLWDPCFCKACRILQERLESSGARPFLPPPSSPSWFYGAGSSWDSSSNGGEGRIQCYKCGMEETLWVCLTCGIVGCGRYSYGHAERHFVEYRHPFSLELATQRIWDYETSSFVQRDDLLNCPFMQQILGAVNRAAYHGAAMCSSSTAIGGVDECHTQGQNDGVAKKTIMVGEQYEAMLQSALDDQAQHYQGEISRLEAELAAETVNVANLSPPELKQIEELERNIAKMRAEVEKMSRYLVEAQAEEASHRTKANVLLREQSVASKLLEKLRQEFELEQEQGEQQMEELKQQISDISANIRLQERIAKNGNLKEAHILGTSDVLVREQSKKRSSRKNKR